MRIFIVFPCNKVTLLALEPTSFELHLKKIIRSLMLYPLRHKACWMLAVGSLSKPAKLNPESPNHSIVILNLPISKLQFNFKLEIRVHKSSYDWKLNGRRIGEKQALEWQPLMGLRPTNFELEINCQLATHERLPLKFILCLVNLNN